MTLHANDLSRRQFLKLAGISILGASLPDSLTTSARTITHRGRTLAPARVFSTPSPDAIPHQILWPDTVVSIHAQQSDWYRLDTGYVHRSDVQPMEPKTHSATHQVSEPPFWAEVAAPVASIRQWCAPDAPLNARVGHGGTARVIDHLPGWYCVQTGQHPLGWSWANAWRTVSETPITTHNLRIVIADQCMSVFRDDEKILYTPISTGQSLVQGTYPLRRGVPSGDFWPYRGAAWLMSAGEYHLAGVYWHNRFGEPVAGPAIQLQSFLARWLYRHIDGSTTLEIR